MVQPEPVEAAEPGDPVVPFRPLILVVHPAVDDGVEVTLEMDGAIASGWAAVGGGAADQVTATARATCLAVQRLLPEGITLAVEWVEQVDGTGDRQRRVDVAVALAVAESGVTEVLLGAAFVRSDTHVAAARATLDGLGRRLALLVHDR